MKSTNKEHFAFTGSPDESSDDQVFVKMLQMPDEVFVYAVYRKLLGRNPDSEGLARYMGLQKRYGKLLVLAEIRASCEGRQKTYMFNSLQLDKLVRLYRVIYFLPFGGLRWKLLKLAINPASRFAAGSIGISGDVLSINKQDNLSKASSNDFVAYRRDVYWIQKISGQTLKLSYKDSDDEFDGTDLLMLIDRIYCSEKPPD